MSKIKRDYTPRKPNNPVRGCANNGLRIIAFLLMLVFGGATIISIYQAISSQDPVFLQLILVTVLLTLACAAIAFRLRPAIASDDGGTPEKIILGCWRLFVRVQAGLLCIGLGGVALNYIIISVRDATTQHWLVVLLAGFFSYVTGTIAFKKRPPNNDDKPKNG